jgi:hypothetical protein
VVHRCVWSPRRPLEERWVHCWTIIAPGKDLRMKMARDDWSNIASCGMLLTQNWLSEDVRLGQRIGEATTSVSILTPAVNTYSTRLP